ncbi:MAG: response regulator transcription factor [candidate division KSB1 bacterium]|jgi:DNA-binding response OmpR family regulator|nr:response regulator transcription factor [candidate division KSB1 bacterium]
MPRILIVEDEEMMRQGLADNLKYEGYEVEQADNGEDGLKKILQNSWQLIILDIMLPKMSGFDVCVKAREAGSSTPVIMLTAKGEEVDKIVGLELGADDYITKPFSLRELLARIKAILRRSSDVGQDKIKIGKAVINFKSYEATVDEQHLAMTHKEVEILKFLWQHRNEIVSRDQLLDSVWGYDEMITSRTVDNFIVRLRQKIEEDPSSPRIILTVHGAGYKLVV